MLKKELFLLLSGISILSVIFIWRIKTDSSQIFPLKGKEVIIHTSHEAVKEGYSSINYFFNSDSALVFKYSLSKQIQEPIVALYFHKPLKKDSYFDFSSYNQLTIHLKSLRGKRIPIYLTIDYKNLKSSSQQFLSMPLVQVIDYKGEGEYRLLKKDFEVPSWWLRHHGLKREDIHELDFSRVNYVLVNSCQTLAPNVEDEITVKYLLFTHNNSWGYALFAAALVMLLSFFAIRYFWRKRKQVIIPYISSDLHLFENGTKIERVLHFIGNNYINPELSITDVQEALGISTREIGTLIKDELKTSFKGYLNAVRLAEIKRLLVETELPVSEIAYKTGYNNVSHFNRVFKKEVGVSPKEYRAQ